LIDLKEDKVLEYLNPISKAKREAELVCHHTTPFSVLLLLFFLRGNALMSLCSSSYHLTVKKDLNEMKFGQRQLIHKRKQQKLDKARKADQEFTIQ
jgi:hypothetical protein